MMALPQIFADRLNLCSPSDIQSREYSADLHAFCEVLRIYNSAYLRNVVCEDRAKKA